MSMSLGKFGMNDEPRKVKFSTFNAGYSHESARMKVLGFEIGKVYNVEYVEVGGWSSAVVLKEFPTMQFNTVFFEDYNEVAEAESKKEAGISAAVETRRHVYDIAKELALKVANRNAKREVTADDVQFELIGAGYDPADLGNAAGALFRGKDWVFTGEWRKSARETNHRRANRVWRLA